MRRPIQATLEAPGQDSFLDTLTNTVGILIILVIVTGLRVKHFGSDTAAAPALEAARAALEAERGRARSLAGAVDERLDQIAQLQQEAAAAQVRRAQQATLAALAEKEIAARRDELDSGRRAAFDLLGRVELAREELADLDRQRAALAGVKPAPIEIENRPTPLSRPADAKEIHFQLLHGRVIQIPLDELIAEFKADAQRRVGEVLDLPELTETVGPQGGFRLRYTIERREITPEMGMGRVGVYAELRRWTLVPVDDELGEPIEEALAADSQFRRAIARYRPSQTAITLWVYDDSFEAFRRVRADLYEQGFQIAARPLPAGTPIGGSPGGTRSALQ
jgi:hypothetical protein